jgi:endonuclease/exonuclease/phosphatase family metal-dependent hydrolase
VFVSDDLAPRVRGTHVDLTSDASDHQPMLLEVHTEP